MNPNLKLLVIAGPTGSGKSDLAMKAARRLDGEIISVDSMQVYRQFDIGTAKPTAQMTREIPHHLINIVEPNQPFMMWDFRLAAQNAIERIFAKNKTVLLVGGTGLYLKTLLENLDGGVKADPQLRVELNEELAANGLPFMYEKLCSVDRQKADKVHANDRHRVLRALESALTPSVGAAPAQNRYDATIFVLGGARKLLYERINLRVVKMFEAGWIDETRDILSGGYDKNCKPFQSLGYRQIIQFLDGKLTEQELVPVVQQLTRHYAKRQITWFARASGAIWLDSISGSGDGDLLVDFMARRFAQSR